jgi:enamine deaminase RidA (YjgF/YER057c/UK114 family)
VRKRLFTWRGQGFVHLGLEGKAGEPLDQQSKGLFARAATELAACGLTLDNNVVRTRVFGRTREARNAVSDVRARTFIGNARAATSSFIAPAHFESGADVALDLIAMSPPEDGAARHVVEHQPQQTFIRYLTWGPMVFLAGMTCEQHPTLKQQYEDILPRAGRLLAEAGCDWRNVVGISFFLHKDHDPDALLTGVAKTVPVALDNAEVEFVEGFSRPGKLVEIEITAQRPSAKSP